MVACVSEPNIEIGAIVKVETKGGLVAEGLVTSFDADRKLLVIDTKQTAVAKPMMRIFNTGHMKNINVVTKAADETAKQAKDTSTKFRQNNPVNGTKTHDRVSKTIGELRPNFMKQDVTVKGQQAYALLKRTIPDTIWSGDDIRVLGLVLVQKPYDVPNVMKDAKATGFDETRANSVLLQVQKILSKPSTDPATRASLDFTIGAVATV